MNNESECRCLVCQSAWSAVGSLPHSQRFYSRQMESLSGSSGKRAPQWSPPRCPNGPHLFCACRVAGCGRHTFSHHSRAEAAARTGHCGQPEPTLRQSDSTLILLPVFPLEDRGVDLFEPVGDDARRFVVIVDAVACIGEGHGIRALGIAEGQSPAIPITRQIGEGPGTEFALVERIRTNFVEAGRRSCGPRRALVGASCPQQRRLQTSRTVHPSLPRL